MRDHLRVADLESAAGMVDFVLVTPQPVPPGVLDVFVHRSGSSVLMIWRTPAVLFISEFARPAWPVPRHRWKTIIIEGRELFTLGPGDPQGGQSVACTVGDTFVRIGGQYTLEQMVRLAMSMPFPPGS